MNDLKQGNIKRRTQNKKYACNVGAGNGIVLTIGVTMVALMMAALAVDIPFYFSVQNQLQTSAEAAALAGGYELYNSLGDTPDDKMSDADDRATDYAELNFETNLRAEDITFGYNDFINGTGFSAGPSLTGYESTGGYNAISVTVWADDDNSGTGSGGPVPTIFARLFGIQEFDSAATATAALDNRIGGMSGLRPIYGCQAQWDLANADDDLTNDVVQIYGEEFRLNGDPLTCPVPGPGNWGFADLRDCSPGSPGTSNMRDWFAEGFPGMVSTGECYSTSPGNFISSISDELDTLIADETVITIPIIDTFNGGGSNTSVDVSSFAGFVITDYRGNGPASGRYIEGYFTSTTCSSDCVVDPSMMNGGSIAKLRLVDGS